MYHDVACKCSLIFESPRRGARRPRVALLILGTPRMFDSLEV